MVCRFTVPVSLKCQGEGVSLRTGPILERVAFSRVGRCGLSFVFQKHIDVYNEAVIL